MNTFKKYTSGVFCMQSSDIYEHGQEAQITTKYGKLVDVMVYKFLKSVNGFNYYSVVRLDGKNSKAHYLNLAEKRKAQALRAEVKSNEYYEKSNKHRDFLILGEPIKVGHHSERRHRKIIDEAYNNMGKSVAESKKAEILESKSEGLEAKAENLFIDTPEGLQGLIDKVAELESLLLDYKARKVESFMISNLRQNLSRYKKRLETAKQLWCLDFDNSAPTKKQLQEKERANKKALVDKALTDNGIIWAFSDEQFNKNKVNGFEYVSIGLGGYCPKQNIDAFLSVYKSI